MRVLLDTNILVSGILSADSPPAQLLHLWWERRFELVSSEVQFEELRSVLARPKITRRIGAVETALLLAALEAELICARDLPVVSASPDPDDNRILATAIAGKADLIVSGDRAGMLDLGSVSGIPIVTAREALGRLGQNQE